MPGMARSSSEKRQTGRAKRRVRITIFHLPSRMQRAASTLLALWNSRGVATPRGKADNNFNVHYNAAGAFHDELVRTPDGWRIKFRRLEVYFGDPLEIATVG